MRIEVKLVQLDKGYQLTWQQKARDGSKKQVADVLPDMAAVTKRLGELALAAETKRLEVRSATGRDR